MTRSKVVILPMKRLIFGGLSTEGAKRNICILPVDVSLVNALSSETILKQYIETGKDSYDSILIGFTPSLGMISIHAFVAADSALNPVQDHIICQTREACDAGFIGFST